MSLFSNRELAIIIWIVCLLIFAMFHPKIRPSFVNVVRKFFVKPILISITWMLCYVCIIVFILCRLGLYESSQIKDTVIWTITVAVASLANINSISADENYFKEAIIKNIVALIGIEFVVSYYTFSLVIELLIIPIAVLIGGMLAVSETDKKYKTVETLLKRVVALFGLFTIIYAIYNLVTGFEEFISSGALADLCLPVILTFLYLPFIYIISLYLEYQNVFRRVGVSIKDTKLLRYAKIRAIIQYNFRKRCLNRWCTSLGHFTLESKEDVIASFQRIKEVIKVEKKTKESESDCSYGWNPFIAKDFLKENGLITGYYNPCGVDEWYSFTPYLNLGGEPISNNLAYYVDGNFKTAKSLKLVLHVNHIGLAKEATEVFLLNAEKLYKKAIMNELPDQFKKAILAGNNVNITVNGNMAISFLKDKWTGKIGGYTLEFCIGNTSDNQE